MYIENYHFYRRIAIFTCVDNFLLPRLSTTPKFEVRNGYVFLNIRIYRQYTTEERHRSVRMLWSFNNIVLYWIKVSQLRFIFVFFFMNNPIRGNLHTLHCHVLWCIYINNDVHTQIHITTSKVSFFQRIGDNFHQKIIKIVTKTTLCY